MGEIAEMMLDGTLCECCGEYIHDGEAEGFPRYCSTDCALGRGVELNTLFNLKELDEELDDEMNENTIENISESLECDCEIIAEDVINLQKLGKIKKARKLKNFIKQLEIFAKSLKY